MVTEQSGQRNLMMTKPSPIVVITGATNGIGLATKKLMQTKGVVTIVCDRENNDEPNYIFLDLMNSESIAECVRSIPDGIDALINCAGVAPINHSNEAVLQVNWLGTKSLTEQVLPKIKPTGSVTTVASRAGANWEANVIQLKRFLTASSDDVTRICDIDSLTPARAYELSKELLIYWSMTQSATQQSIRFNTVSPSSVETRLTPSFREAFKSRKINNNSLRKRSTTPDEIAEVIWLLAKPSTRSINGIDLKVDQGITAQRKITELEHNGNGE